jgi:hypothetical protein
MARSITLTLGAGMGADLGPNFNLTANVGSVTPSTATKSELTAGKSVSVDDAATQVTITSTGTCTNAATQTIPCAGGTTTSTTTTTTTTTPPTSTLYVYATDVGVGQIVLYAGVNGAAGTTIYDESVDGSIGNICGLIYTFFGTLSPGDTVTFSTNTNCIMAGDDTNVCPSATGSGTTFTTALMVAGQNYVALGLNSSINP